MPTERSTIGISKGSATCARLMPEVRQPFSSSVERGCDMRTHAVVPADRGQPSSALGARRSSGAGQSSLLVGGACATAGDTAVGALVDECARRRGDHKTGLRRVGHTRGRARGGGGWTRSTMSCNRSLCTVPSTWRIIRAPSQNATRRAWHCFCTVLPWTVRTIEWRCLRARTRARAVSA